MYAIEVPYFERKDIVVGELLGRGTYGTVYKAFDKRAGRQVAIKCIDYKVVMQTESAKDALVQEIGLLKLLRHPNIVQLLNHLWHGHTIYMIMEYCGGKDLCAYLKKYNSLSEAVTARFFRQLASALHYLRRVNVCHFDLKPQNILLTAPPNLQLKLADFGFARFLKCGAVIAGVRGTPLYMAPEMLLRGTSVPESDLWSAGVIMYECLCGRVPFYAQTVQMMALIVRAVRRVHLPDFLVKRLSVDCVDLLQKLLQVDAAQRIKFDDFFRHRFINLLPTSDQHAIACGKAKLSQAINADRNADYEKAVRLYAEGSELLLAQMKTFTAVEKAQISVDLENFLDRAETLKYHIGKGKKRQVEVSKTHAQEYKHEIVQACLLLSLDAHKFSSAGDYGAAAAKYDLVLSSAVALLTGDREVVPNFNLGDYIQQWTLQRDQCREKLKMLELKDEKSNSTHKKALMDQECCVQ